MGLRERHVLLFGLVALIVAGVLVGIVWSNLSHGDEEKHVVNILD